MKKTISNFIISLVMILAIAGTVALIFTIAKANPETPTQRTYRAAEIIIQKQVFDTSALNTWCGEPNGTIRMIGAQALDENTLEDETGNLWGWDDVEEQSFYLLWIDDMGTPQIEDDEIVKIWEEKG